MSPIEVAIDEMDSRAKELKEIINKSPTDIKKLQLKLQVSLFWINKNFLELIYRILYFIYKQR